MSLNSAAAVYAEAGPDVMISAAEEIMAEEPGDAGVIVVDNEIALKETLESVLTKNTTVTLTADIEGISEPK